VDEKMASPCSLSTVDSQERAATYLALQFLKNSSCEIFHYNEKLLRKLAIQAEPEPVDPRPPIGSAEEAAYFAALYSDED